jgi:hypothetical protein
LIFYRTIVKNCSIPACFGGLIGEIWDSDIYFWASDGELLWFFKGLFRLMQQLAELEGNIKSAEAVNSELRKQIEQKDSEINQIRNELNTERQSKVEALQA